MTGETAIVVQKELDCRIDISMLVTHPHMTTVIICVTTVITHADDRSSSQNCSSANYSPPVKDNIPKCYCYRIDIDFSNEQHA
jgi:hypothetical protein